MGFDFGFRVVFVKSARVSVASVCKVLKACAVDLVVCSSCGGGFRHVGCERGRNASSMIFLIVPTTTLVYHATKPVLNSCG